MSDLAKKYEGDVIDFARMSIRHAALLIDDGWDKADAIDHAIYNITVASDWTKRRLADLVCEISDNRDAWENITVRENMASGPGFTCDRAAYALMEDVRDAVAEIFGDSDLPEIARLQSLQPRDWSVGTTRQVSEPLPEQVWIVQIHGGDDNCDFAAFIHHEHADRYAELRAMHALECEVGAVDVARMAAEGHDLVLEAGDRDLLWVDIEQRPLNSDGPTEDEKRLW